MASSTEEVSAANNDLSGGSRRDDEQFGVFKDFDFLEYESESVEVFPWNILFLDYLICGLNISYREKALIISIGV